MDDTNIQTKVNDRNTSAPLTVAEFAKYYEELINFLSKQAEKTEERFEQIDRRFEQIDARFEQIDARFDEIDRRFEEMGITFDFIRKEIEEIKQKLEQLSTRTLEDTNVLGKDFLDLRKRVEKLEKIFTNLQTKPVN